jgi:hypothetical protein
VLERTPVSVGVSLGGHIDLSGNHQIAGYDSYAHSGPRRAWCVGCRAGVSRAMLSPVWEGAAVQDGASCVMNGPPRRGML